MMRVEFVKPYTGGLGNFQPGDTLTVRDVVAIDWEESGAAKIVEELEADKGENGNPADSSPDA
jgi:hypothetical protein